MMLDIRPLLENKTLLGFAVIIYSCAITVIFLMPTRDLPRVSLPGGADKMVHFLIHFVLVFLWQLYVLRRNHNKLLWKHGFVVLLGSLFYGIVIEILQGYLTLQRKPDAYDVIANLVGALAGVFLFQKVKRFFIP